MRAVIYTRVSQDDGSARSVSEQEAECREFCAEQNWDVHKVLTDNDIGASRWSIGERPAYIELKKILRPSDVLVTWEASRAQRDLAAFVELRDLCAAIGVKWAYTGRVYDLTDGNDRYITGMDALNAEREAEIIRARVLRGKRAAATAGRPGSGKVPPGFRVVRDERTGKPMTWEPSELAPVMQEAAQRILAGEPLREVTRWANENGVAGNHTRLRERLKMASYAGLRVYQGEVLRDANWEGLWTPEVRKQLLAEFERRAHGSNHGGGLAVKHLLAGLAKCGVCGAGMRHYWPPSAQRRCAPPSYICPSGSAHVRRRADRIEAMVEETVLAILRAMDPNAVFGACDDSEATKHWDEARELQERLDAFTESAADGELTPRALAKIEGKLLPQIAEAEAKARAATRHENPIVAQLAEDPDDWFDRTVMEKREVIRALIELVEIRPTTARGRSVFIDDDIVINPY